MVMNQEMIFLLVQGNLMMRFADSQLNDFLHLGWMSANGFAFAEPSLVYNSTGCSTYIQHRHLCYHIQILMDLLNRDTSNQPFLLTLTILGETCRTMWL
jgi:hypothetical protein